MTLFFTFFCIFSSLALLSGVLVIISKNPVFSVLFLINLEFLPVTFLVVYVGAIAVLFLFVLMMLNINLTELKANTAHFIPVIVILSLTFIAQLSILTRLEFVPLSFSFVNSLLLSDFANFNVIFNDLSYLYSSDDNMRLIGQILFVDFSVHFIVVAYILLLAMVGAICLTIQKKFLSKSQNVYFQVIRNHNKSLFFYS
jgi:NADH:ubiquinone oxidoreductase subunit 6 (subunit J)